MKIISRKRAKDQGLQYYFTGMPCKHGHFSKRYTKNAICVECARSKSAQRRAEDPEGVRASMKAYYQKTADHWKQRRREKYKQNPELCRESIYKFRRENPEHIRDIKKRYYRNNEEKIKAAVSKYRRDNKEKVKTWTRQYRARRKGAIGSHNQEDVELLYERQKMLCASCAKHIKNGYHVDHIVPLSKGGTDNPDNIQLLCPSCNCSKQDKTPQEWAAENGRLL